MVWNKDLAKLKQDLKSEGGAEPKAPVPKPVAKPSVPKQIEDEDALFLAAMGKRRKLAPEPEEMLSQPQDANASKPESMDFKTAMSSMKGLKPMLDPQPTAPEPPQLIETPATPLPPDVFAEATAVSAFPPSPPHPAKDPEPPRVAPVLIQLAAGMAIDVDGLLDLRGHSPSDAIDRLKERILDGHLLGWRTIHIQLGPSEELRQAFQGFLGSPEAELIGRYAQAPIPMGGAQAWILYLGLQGITTH
jgi:hypothetical protein